MSYGRIRRGPMAADQFTQISNALFRDPRLSAKAKGIFGFISTHREDWGVTPESIAAAMKDGVSAIKAGLRELEQHGYLLRSQERRADGTMGPILYQITDMPRSEPVDDIHPAVSTCANFGSVEDSEAGVHSRRSEPVDGYPLAVNPPADNRPPKKTSTKKTREENTNRPSVPEQLASEDTEGGTDGPAVPHQIGRNPGVDLLSAIGAQQPEFLLTGKTLQDQGLAVAGMLLQGWTREQVRQVVAGRPLPENIRTTVGAVVARRLRDALSGPAPHLGQFKADRDPKDKPTPTPAAWNADTVAPRKRVGECEGNNGLCGRPTEPDSNLCRHCAKSPAYAREDVTA